MDWVDILTLERLSSDKRSKDPLKDPPPENNLGVRVQSHQINIVRSIRRQDSSESNNLCLKVAWKRNQHG